ncbi:hypothetical protein H6F38_23180 [Paenibacillus sp. EKM208P]|nr:hypothetical protein H6F38_23180 [Paenibacillus sp. EKM208P]
MRFEYDEYNDDHTVEFVQKDACSNDTYFSIYPNDKTWKEVCLWMSPKEAQGFIDKLQASLNKYNQIKSNQINEYHIRKSKTQLAPTPTLYGEDARRLLDSVRNKPTQRSIENHKKLVESFKGIGKSDEQ